MLIPQLLQGVTTDHSLLMHIPKLCLHVKISECKVIFRYVKTVTDEQRNQQIWCTIFAGNIQFNDSSCKQTKHFNFLCFSCYNTLQHSLHRLSKNSQNYFCHSFVKFPPTLVIFGTKMARTIELCKVHSLFTSPNLCHCITVWNTDALNCYCTLPGE